MEGQKTRTYGFILVVERPPHEQILEIGDVLAESLDARLDKAGGRWLVTAYRDGTTPLRAFVDLLKDLSKEAETLRVTRLDDDLVAVSDIASRIGVSRQAVQDFAGQRGFPRPWSTVASARIWRWAEVNEWLREHRSTRADAEYWPLADEAARINGLLAARPEPMKSAEQIDTAVWLGAAGGGASTALVMHPRISADFGLLSVLSERVRARSEILERRLDEVLRADASAREAEASAREALTALRDIQATLEETVVTPSEVRSGDST